MAINLIKGNYLFVVEGQREEFKIIRAIFDSVSNMKPSINETYIRYNENYKFESLCYDGKLFIDILQVGVNTPSSIYDEIFGVDEDRDIGKIINNRLEYKRKYSDVFIVMDTDFYSIGNYKSNKMQYDGLLKWLELVETSIEYNYHFIVSVPMIQAICDNEDTRCFEIIDNYKKFINDLVGDYRKYIRNNVEVIIRASDSYEKINNMNIENIHHNFLIMTRDAENGVYNISHAFQLLDEVIMIYNKEEKGAKNTKSNEF